MDKQKTTERYDRIARIYDIMEYPVEVMFFARLRKELCASVSGKVLEVGIGTGKNLPYYPSGIDLTGIDISSEMLRKAELRAGEMRYDVELMVMDVEDMTFPDRSFDYVVSTFVFCSVPRPLKGLGEIKRVLKPEGRAIFLEHVRSENTVLGKMMDLFNPVIRSLIGPNINRRTVETIRKSGLKIISIEHKGTAVITHIIGRT